MSIPNNKYRIRFRRIVEGEIVMDAVSLPEAQKLFSIELACGNVPCMKAENEFILSLCKFRPNGVTISLWAV